ncbi:uncharacterized protein TNCV_1872181 [Trichonephila clavipes]|nr:uncharacterized protein TNCV_1872181 [Trichonephila clavipes]
MFVKTYQKLCSGYTDDLESHRNSGSRKCRCCKLWGKEAEKKNRNSITLIRTHLENSSCTQQRKSHQRFSIKVWAFILENYLTGPCLLSSSLGGSVCQIFLQEVHPELLDAAHVPSSLRQSMWYQHDGAPTYYGIHVREKHLNVTFGQWWIGHGGPVHWTARSPKISYMDLFFWGHVKSWVNEATFSSVEGFTARISVVAGRVRDMSGIFQNVPVRTDGTCQMTSDHNFELLL